MRFPAIGLVGHGCRNKWAATIYGLIDAVRWAFPRSDVLSNAEATEVWEPYRPSPLPVQTSNKISIPLFSRFSSDSIAFRISVWRRIWRFMVWFLQIFTLLKRLWFFKSYFLFPLWFSYCDTFCNSLFFCRQLFLLVIDHRSAMCLWIRNM